MARTKQTNFYATYDDIAEVLQLFESEECAIYILTGLFDTDDPQLFKTFRAINSLSVSTEGDANLVPGYLIAEEHHQFSVREVPPKIGGTKFAVDQLENPDTVQYWDYPMVSGMLGAGPASTAATDTNK